jgi:hypothetical protein
MGDGLIRDPLAMRLHSADHLAIQTLKNVARGYRNFANFRIAILFHHGKLDLAPR